MVNIEEIKKEYQDLLNQLSSPELISDFEKFEELSKKKKKLEEILEKQELLEKNQKQIEENKTIITSPEDFDLKNLAETELNYLIEENKKLEKEIESIFLSIDEKNNEKGPKYDSAIIEIRAGTGGDEAAIFAADLFKMYSKYADIKGWKKKILDSHPTELNGYKTIIFEISNHNIYSEIKYEGGVHRVQRIPKTEKGGRIHTSTATVAVLPKPKKTEIKIKPDEIKIDYFKSSGPGGQNVNKRETAVRITHIPSGIMVASQTERNQLQNRENALSILSAKLLEKKQKEEVLKTKNSRKSQIGQAKRVEKIRTYNFPQNRVTDHRIKKSWHNIEEIMNGELDKIIKELKNNLPNK